MSISEFLDLMPDSITIEPFVSYDGYNNPTYGAAVTHKARVVGKVRRVTTATGEEKVSMKTVYLGAAVRVGVLDRITLPSGHEPQQPPILNAGEYPDEGGLHHSEVLL